MDGDAKGDITMRFGTATPPPSRAPSTQPQPTALTAVRQNGLLQKREIFAVAGSRVRLVGSRSHGPGAHFRRCERKGWFRLPQSRGGAPLNITDLVAEMPKVHDEPRSSRGLRACLVHAIAGDNELPGQISYSSRVRQNMQGG